LSAHRRGLQIELDHPTAGSVPGVANPIRFSKTPLEFERAPPLLGQDTDAVLARLLGLDERALEELREQAVIV